MAHAWTRLPAAAMLLALAVLAGACGAAGGQPTPVASPRLESPSDGGMQAAADAAVAEAATRFGLPGADIQVQHVEARQWPDSSLGCPSQDVMYSQVVTPGYLVVLSAAGKQLEYHADTRGTVVFCQAA